jgi:hypothetical protein
MLNNIFNNNYILSTYIITFNDLQATGVIATDFVFREELHINLQFTSTSCPNSSTEK